MRADAPDAALLSKGRCCSRAADATARPMGCSLACSAEAARRSGRLPRREDDEEDDGEEDDGEKNGKCENER